MAGPTRESNQLCACESESARTQATHRQIGAMILMMKDARVMSMEELQVFLNSSGFCSCFPAQASLFESRNEFSIYTRGLASSSSTDCALEKPAVDASSHATRRSDQWG